MQTKNGKKIVRKKCEKRFLHPHEYRDQKNGGKITRKTIFAETHVYSDQKMLGKIRRERCEKTFLIFIRI